MKRVLYNFRYKWSLSMLNGDDIDKKQYSTLWCYWGDDFEERESYGTRMLIVVDWKRSVIAYNIYIYIPPLDIFA